MTRLDNPVPAKTRAFLRGKARAKATEARQAKAEEIAVAPLLSGQNCPVHEGDCQYMRAIARCKEAIASKICR